MYEHKYLKYKQKYLKHKLELGQTGGTNVNILLDGTSSSDKITDIKLFCETWIYTY